MSFFRLPEHSAVLSALPAVLAWMVPFLAHLTLVAPGVTWGDAGDLLVAAHDGGVPHPSGYPLYMLLCRALLWIVPGLDPAPWIALLSVLATSATSYVLFRTVRELTADPLSSLWAALLYALALEPSAAARQVEVYALHLLFFALFLITLQQWFVGGRGRSLYLACLVTGLGLAHHLTTIFLLPPLGLALFLHLPGLPEHRKKLRTLLAASSLAILPALFYLYLPLATLFAPPTTLCWNEPTTWSAFLGQVLGSEYRIFWTFEPSAVFSRVGELGSVLLQQFGPLPWLLALLGASLLLRRHKALAAALLLTLLGFFMHAATYQVNDYTQYCLPIIATGALLAGLGAAALSTYCSRRGSRRLGLLLGSALFLLPLSEALDNRFLLHVGAASEEYASRVWELTPPGSLIVAGDDNTFFPLWYQARVRDPDRSRAVVSAGLFLHRIWYRNYLRRAMPELRLPDEASLRGRTLDLHADLLGPNYRPGHTFLRFSPLPNPADLTVLNRGLLNELVPTSASPLEANTTLEAVTLSHARSYYREDHWLHFPYRLDGPFSPGLPIHCTLTWADNHPHAVSWEWYGPRDTLLRQDRREHSSGERESRSILEIPEDKPHLRGAWRVEVRVDGRLVARRPFLVVPGP
ncbi:MAG: hypothetical protein A2284_14815 [Deltaproteobacteria bacterium RIFOXYA12_FULL_61_11]|nr:MAG: hypothetical protein A2284_14815 [Deltaproteobacteria bacterium RIFOXYA12_FULL_61_11]